jgi:hypothetical protein
MLHEIWKTIHTSSFNLGGSNLITGNRIIATCWAHRNPEGVEIE